MSAGAATDGPTVLADALERRRTADAQSTFTTAQVVGGSTDQQVAVDMDGEVQRWPFVAGYTPRIGDAVVLGGGPGWWVCLGSISGVGPARAAKQTVSELEVNGPSTTFGLDRAYRYQATTDGPGFTGPSANINGVVVNGGGISAPGKNISTDPNGSMNSLQIACGNLTYGTLTQGSDARLKDVDDHLGDIDAAADQLLAAPVRSWRWRAKWAWDDENGQWVDVTPDHGRHLGIVAQDAPAPLQVRRDDGYLALDRATYDGLLLRIVQRQDARIAELEAAVRGG